MNSATYSRLTEQLKDQEGFVPYLYNCPAGYPTIGYGHNCEAHKDIDKYLGRAIGTHEADNILENDLNAVIKDCSKIIRSFESLPEIQQAVLANMTFNMGADKIKKFHKMLIAIDLGDTKRIAREMINSKWASQVGRRSTELVFMILTNEWF